LATDGAASALALVAAATLEPGDEVLLPDPVDFLFRTAVERAGATPVPVPLDRATTGPDHVEALARRLTPRTRMLWLCNPHNPLGRAFGRDWLQAVGAWAVEHGLRILVDEVWSDIVYPPARHVSLASLSPAIAARVATVHGFSKGYGLAGLRIGCIVCTDERWREALLLGSGATSTLAGASVLSQAAAVAALDGGSDWLRGFLEHLRQQRDLAVARMARWPGVRVTAPESTFVLLADVRALTTDAAAWCETLRREARVALVPGGRRWFGEASEGHVRLSFATSREILGEALDRVEDWLRGRVG
ncbi:MAG TPA: pyridoxal phosphate-dependent aminotransferase, partial [Burkholderiaceae bacterium]